MHLETNSFHCMSIVTIGKKENVSKFIIASAGKNVNMKLGKQVCMNSLPTKKHTPYFMDFLKETR